jgi:hypothetical protein
MGTVGDSMNELMMSSCRFRKFHPAQIRVMKQNHRIILIDVCDPARARNICRRHVQVAVSSSG